MQLDVQAIGRLNQLTHLSLSCDVMDGGRYFLLDLYSLTSLKRLKFMALAEVTVTGGLFQVAAACTCITELELIHINVESEEESGTFDMLASINGAGVV